MQQPQTQYDPDAQRYGEHIERTPFLGVDHTILYSMRDRRGVALQSHRMLGDVFGMNFPNQYNATYYIRDRIIRDRIICREDHVYKTDMLHFGAHASGVESKFSILLAIQSQLKYDCRCQ